MRVRSVLAHGGLVGLLALALAGSPSARAESAAGDDSERDVGVPDTMDRFDTVVIDPGHGGEDLGAVGPDGVREKDVVLGVALRLAELLRGDGLRVAMTREDDRAVALAERASEANALDADLFLSIHANAAPSPVARGIETFFPALRASDEAAGRVAERENAAFGAAAAPQTGASDPLLALLGDLVHTEHLAGSGEFARLAHARLAAIDAAPSRGVKQAPFLVLLHVQMPATLVEIGFITNQGEERSLGRPERQAQIAAVLADAVREFRRRHDARRGLDARDGLDGKRVRGHDQGPADAGTGS
ncbi:MAG TPA: N-acetylmuramoyl-L-alanine amidase [Myxococcota bacterium]|jgi:N-acetylmuramoyl-L-alanine amidase|nr:N-acetylmuramoyl-L-alanine amidase [Myxococcota bacterium]